MKYKFKPQTGILVAGLLAVTYAEATCWYQGTSAVCFLSGDTVDQIVWNNGTSTSKTPVTATADWSVNAPAGGTGYLVHSGTGGTGYTTYTADPSVTDPTSCDGPGQFRDYSNHLTSVNDWWSDTADYQGNITGTYNHYPSADIHAGTVNTGTTCQ